MTVDDVVAWVIADGIGHVVAERRDAVWLLTACGTFGTFGEPQKEKPARICRRCRERLRTATPYRDGQGRVAARQDHPPASPLED